MTSSLLDQFIEEECTPYVRRLLHEALRATSPSSRRLEFNRFEVTIQHEENEVLVEDILDAADVGAQRVPLAEFVEALGECPT